MHQQYEKPEVHLPCLSLVSARGTKPINMMVLTHLDKGCMDLQVVAGS